MMNNQHSESRCQPCRRRRDQERVVFSSGLCKLMMAGLVLLLTAGSSLAQPPGVNYTESKVPPYTLPNPLVMASGRRVTSARIWIEKQRPQLLRLFEENVYGRSPERPPEMIFRVTSVDRNALGGKAIRKLVTIFLNGKKPGPKIHLLIYLPKNAPGPAPMFLGLNFSGNQSISLDPGIPLSKGWMPGPHWGVVNHHATEATRGVQMCRWPVLEILSRGYGLATAYYGDIEPDYNGGLVHGVRGMFLKPGQTHVAPDQWGAIGAWAWGLSRVMDYLETDKDVDAHRVAVVGHSRLGKTALWAGAQDTRFAMVISNCSGEGGAALSRRWFGETVKSINTHFPWWFCGNFKKYNDNVNALPVDQHELIALIAPRPVYIASAAGDLWADPKGMFLAAKAASPVYKLLGTSGFGGTQMPGIDQPIMTRIGFHLRSGPHNMTDYDWAQYLNFADKYLKAH